jgi:hypothetical protein
MIYWFIFIALEIARNYYMIVVKKTKPVYFQSFLIRGMAHVFVVGLFYDVTVPSYWPSIYELIDLDYWPILLFHVTSFWLIFDPLLNLLRGKPWNYRGKTSGWLDRIPSHIIYWLLKVAALTFFIQYLL